MGWTNSQQTFVRQSLGKVQSPVPAGVYNVEVINSRCTTDNGSRPVLRLHLRIIDGKYLGKKLFYDLRFTPPYVKSTKAFLLVCGIKSYGQLRDGAVKGHELIAEVQGYETLDSRQTNIVVAVALAEE